MQPDQCQKRQKVRNDVSLHRLCRYRGQNEEQTERGKMLDREGEREWGGREHEEQTERGSTGDKQTRDRQRGRRRERTQRNEVYTHEKERT